MTVWESILVGLFCLLGVFVVLIALCIIIKLFSFVLGSIANSSKSILAPAQQLAPNPQIDFSSGNLRLKDVDEPTAAMIMAIVSDESGIPLNELQFKSIKLLQQDK